MLIMGICNPRGESSSYNGLYLTENELYQIVDDNRLLDLPVKTEHAGGDIGKIVSSHVNPKGELQCVMEIKDEANGSVVGGFIRDGIALELSLGYVVDVTQSEKRLKAGEKRVIEVSVVKKGARDGCHILAYEKNGAIFTNRVLSRSDWTSFCEDKIV
jgi:hypothetical protein